MSTPHLADFVKAYDVRGLVPEQLNVDVAWALGSAFAQAVVLPEGASGVVIGHDMRPSSPELSRAFAAGVTAHGLDATLIGLFAVMVIQDPVMSLVGLIIAPPAMIMLRKMVRRVRAIIKVQFTGGTQTIETLQEALQGLRRICADQPTTGEERDGRGLAGQVLVLDGDAVDASLDELEPRRRRLVEVSVDHAAPAGSGERRRRRACG